MDDLLRRATTGLPDDVARRVEAVFQELRRETLSARRKVAATELRRYIEQVSPVYAAARNWKNLHTFWNTAADWKFSIRHDLIERRIQNDAPGSSLAREYREALDAWRTYIKKHGGKLAE